MEKTGKIFHRRERQTRRDKKRESTKILDGIVSRRGAKAQSFLATELTGDTELEAEKLKCKTQNQN